MSLLSDVRERVRAIFLRGRAEQEMHEELRFHIEREVEERVRRGVDPAAARREALVAFGGLELRKEEVREARGVLPWEELTGDFRHAARALLRNPVFTATGVLVLALGIGATTAVFGIADAVLFSELPYRQPDRLVRLNLRNSEPRNIFNLSVADALGVAERQRSFESIGFITRLDAGVSSGGTAEEARVSRVTSGYFRALGATTAVGRLTSPADDRPGAPPVVVVSNALATRRFGGAASALGRSLSIESVPHTVIGVLPRGVTELAGSPGDIWTALQLETPKRRGPFLYRGIARLRDGITIDDATRDLERVSREIYPIWVAGFRDSTARVFPIPLREAIVGKAAHQRVNMLAGGVVLVLLVAIANVAMLMLVRTAAREQELSVRTALGASRLRLLRLLSSESLVLCAVAAVAGIALAALILRIAPSLMPDLPRIEGAHTNAQVVAVAVGAAILSAVVVTIAPLLSVLARPTRTSIRAEGARIDSSPRSNLARAVLVSVEFGLALPLLFGAGLLLNSFLRLQRVDVGFDPTGVVSVHVGLPPARYADLQKRQLFWRELEQRVHDLALTSDVGLTTELPPEAGNINNFNLVDRPVSNTAEPLTPWINATNGYFAALKSPLLEGRDFVLADGDSTAAPVVVVSRSWARRYYPNESVLGKQLIEGGCYECPRTTIVGVVGDVKYWGLRGNNDAMYAPLTQSNTSEVEIVVRTRSTPANTFAALRNVVASMDPELPVVQTTMEERLGEYLANPFRWTTILGAFSVVTLVLATVGIFGLMAYTVRQRRREIGIRMALGARPQSVTWMIVARGMRYAAIGTLAGFVIVLFEGRWLGPVLFGVSAMDPLTFFAVATLLLVTAMIACWIAGRRAAQVHPVEAISTN